MRSSAVSIAQPDDQERECKQRESEAAATIQRVWRKKGKAQAQNEQMEQQQHRLNPEQRWDAAADAAKIQTTRLAANENRNDAQKRWKRAGFLAGRLQDSNNVVAKSGGTASADVRSSVDVKMLETQHWLEMTDGKHRYGSNLKYYHKKWLEDDTEDNFFKWLDHGKGKDLSLDECSREQLEKERIIYLSPEQRMNYKVKVDEKGLLRWERTGDLIDTTAGLWQDSGDGSGIVPFDESKSKPTILRRTSFEEAPPLSRNSSLISAGSIDSRNATHYVATKKIRNPALRWMRSHFTPKGWTERILRKTVRRNTWIYVVDKHFNIYIGIKQTGTFQHSSLVAGGQVISAGLITVHNGLIHKLSPLSGHYRTSIDNFRKFVKSLKDRGVDMHKAQINKAELALWGMVRMKETKKAKKELEQKGKERIKDVARQLSPKSGDDDGDKDAHEDDRPQWQNDILFGRKCRPVEQGTELQCKDSDAFTRKESDDIQQSQSLPDSPTVDFPRKKRTSNCITDNSDHPDGDPERSEVLDSVIQSNLNDSRSAHSGGEGQGHART